jgi:hypothetical protein
MSEAITYAEHSGDHRNGPLAVPGPQETGPWGMQWDRENPEPWAGFAEAVQSFDYVFVHSPATSCPTSSCGRGSYVYWKKMVFAGVECYFTTSQEEDADGCYIRTIHLSPTGPVEGLSEWVRAMRALIETRGY